MLKTHTIVIVGQNPIFHVGQVVCFIQESKESCEYPHALNNYLLVGFDQVFLKGVAINQHG